MPHVNPGMRRWGGEGMVSRFFDLSCWEDHGLVFVSNDTDGWPFHVLTNEGCLALFLLYSSVPLLQNHFGAASFSAEPDRAGSSPSHLMARAMTSARSTVAGFHGHPLFARTWCATSLP